MTFVLSFHEAYWVVTNQKPIHSSKYGKNIIQKALKFVRNKIRRVLCQIIINVFH